MAKEAICSVFRSITYNEMCSVVASNAKLSTSFIMSQIARMRNLASFVTVVRKELTTVKMPCLLRSDIFVDAAAWGDRAIRVKRLVPRESTTVKLKEIEYAPICDSATAPHASQVHP